LLILKLAAEDVIAKLSIAPCLIAKIVKHPVWGHVIAIHLACVHKSLLDSKELALVEFNHVGQFTLLLIKFGVLLLFFAELASCLE